MLSTSVDTVLYCNKQTNSPCARHITSAKSVTITKGGVFVAAAVLGLFLDSCCNVMLDVIWSHHIMNDDVDRQHMHASIIHHDHIAWYHQSIILSSFYWSPSSPPRVTCSNRRSDLRIGARYSEYHWHCDHLCGISYNSTFICEVVRSHQFAVGPFHRQPCCIASIVACRVRRLLNSVNIEPLYLEYWTWGCWCLSSMCRWVRRRGLLN